jgi:hypothetical protein
MKWSTFTWVGRYGVVAATTTGTVEYGLWSRNFGRPNVQKASEARNSSGK